MSYQPEVNISTEILQQILRTLNQLNYGSIEITVYDGKVTQIERREKIRFAQEAQKNKITVDTSTLTKN